MSIPILPREFILALSVVLMAEYSWAQSSMSTLQRLDITPDPETMLDHIPVGADGTWLHRLIHQQEHRQRERDILSDHLPESDDASNFGGYINLIKQDVTLNFDPETGFIEETIEVTLDVSRTTGARTLLRNRM